MSKSNNNEEEVPRVFKFVLLILCFLFYAALASVVLQVLAHAAVLSYESLGDFGYFLPGLIWAGAHLAWDNSK